MNNSTFDVNGVFPISDREASLLHDLGWQSGFGWRTDWDWWKSDLDERDSDVARLRLVSNLLTIRAAIDAGAELAKRILDDKK